MFFDFYVTLWGIIPPKKRIRVKIRLEKVDLGEVYIKKEQENFKKRTSSNTIGGPLHISHPEVKHFSIFSSRIGLYADIHNDFFIPHLKTQQAE